MKMEDIDDIQPPYNSTDSSVTVTSWTYLNMDPHIVPIILTSIAVVSLIGNLAALIMVPKISAEKSHNFIYSLALVDFSTILFFLLFAEYPFGDIICKASITFYHASIGLSSLTLIAVGAYAFLDEFGWDKEGNKTTNTNEDDHAKRNAVVAVTFVWTLAVGSAILTAALSGNILEISSENEYTTLCSPYIIEFRILRLALFHAIPYTIVGFCLSLARHKGTLKVPSLAQISVAYSFYLLITVYAVCFYPVCVVALCTLTPHADIDRFWQSVSLAGYGFGVAYRFFNPVALYFASGWFGKVFNSCFHPKSYVTPKQREAEVYKSVNAAFS